MAVVTFDTLKYADTLKAAGVPAAQAEGQARAMADVIQVQFKDLTTKEDLARLRDELKRDIADLAGQFTTKLDQQSVQLSNKIDQQVASLRTELAVLKWMVGLAITLMTGVAIRLFFFKL